MKKLKFTTQIFLGLVLVVLLYLVGEAIGVPVLEKLGWTVMGLSFVLHPALPEGGRFRGASGEMAIRVFGLIIVAAGWLIPSDISLFGSF